MVFVFATGYLGFDIPLFLAGLILLIKGSAWFVDASSFIARNFRVSEVIIGLTLVSIGTSLPELGTNIYASFSGEGEIALGNVVGSNITNIALVLGMGVVLKSPLLVSSRLNNRDVLIMIFTFIFFFFLCFSGFTEGDVHVLNRWDGIVLILLFLSYSVYLFKNKNIIEKIVEEEKDEEHNITTMSQAFLYFIIGLVMIFAGAKMAVDITIVTAESFEIPKEIIATTIIAFGTSVPELAVTITSIAKKKNDLALGNIIGSCIFNIILVMGAATCISPIDVSSKMINILLPLMMFSGIILIIFMRTGKRLVRLEGIGLLLIYAIFIAYNIAQAL